MTNLDLLREARRQFGDRGMQALDDHLIGVLSAVVDRQTWMRSLEMAKQCATEIKEPAA